MNVWLATSFALMNILMICWYAAVLVCAIVVAMVNDVVKYGTLASVPVVLNDAPPTLGAGVKVLLVPAVMLYSLLMPVNPTVVHDPPMHVPVLHGDPSAFGAAVQLLVNVAPGVHV